MSQVSDAKILPWRTSARATGANQRATISWRTTASVTRGTTRAAMRANQLTVKVVSNYG